MLIIITITIIVLLEIHLDLTSSVLCDVYGLLYKALFYSLSMNECFFYKLVFEVDL